MLLTKNYFHSGFLLLGFLLSTPIYLEYPKDNTMVMNTIFKLAWANFNFISR